MKSLQTIDKYLGCVTSVNKKLANGIYLAQINGGEESVVTKISITK